MIESWIPSLIIVASTVAAWAAGRALRWVVARYVPRAARRVRTAVIAAAAVVAVWFLATPSSRYALLLPAAFAVAYVSAGERIAPGVFDR